MLEKMVFLSSYWYSGGEAGRFLYSWENAGVFDYLLPFLLIFSLVFVILTRIDLFGRDNRGTAGIIALAVGLMALRLDFVRTFFSEIFPRLGVGLAVILVLLILVGVFIDPNRGAFMWILLGIGGVIAVIILIQTAGALRWSSGYWWYDNWPLVAGLIFMLIVLGVIVGGGSRGERGRDDYKSLLFFPPTSNSGQR